MPRDLFKNYPVYLPDATRAVVKSLDSSDLKNAGVEAVVVNTYHLATEPGTAVLESYGGIKNFMNFSGIVTSDSGGWQVFSLIHRNKTGGKITDDGVTFSIGSKAKKQLFSPEKSIQTQFAIGSDIIVCLDDFTPPDATQEKIKETVERTILWAKKSKQEYARQVAQRGMGENDRPVLLAVIQGGWDKALRKYCAEKLIEIGFDAYGFGGYVIDKATGKLDLDIAEYIVNLIPKDKLKFALGTGTPFEVAACSQMGWQIFDCTLPTRDARHKRLYVFNKMPVNMADLLDRATYGFVYMARESLKHETTPVSEYCDCLLCKNYSKGYLRHLFDIKDSSAFRLASIHNIRHYTMVTDLIRKFSC